MDKMTKIFDTNHSVDRFLDNIRFPEIKDDFEDNLHYIIYDAINVIKTKHKNQSGNYGIHSKSRGIGVIIDYRPYNKNIRDKENHAFIVTILPIRKFHKFKDSDIAIIVEKLMSEWFKTEYKNRKLTESYKGKNKAYYIQENNFYVTFFDGCYYDCNILDFIVVE